jgi:hypothetical protein
MISMRWPLKLRIVDLGDDAVRRVITVTADGGSGRRKIIRHQAGNLLYGMPALMSTWLFKGGEMINAITWLSDTKRGGLMVTTLSG